MTNEQSLKNISETILSFKSWGQPWEFEDYVLKNLKSNDDLHLFKHIWLVALEFENWNYADLTIGRQKTIEILLKKFNLPEDIALCIANAVGYQWK